MTSAFAAQLRQQIRRRSRLMFDAAVLDVRRQWETAPEGPPEGPESLPFETGFLRRSLRSFNRSVTSDVLRISFSLEALDGGFDYASFLDRAGRVRIQAKKAKALRWFGADGQPVFRRSVDYQNRWQGYWDRWWRAAENSQGGGRWFDALETQAGRIF